MFSLPRNTQFHETRNFTYENPLFGCFDREIEYAAAYKHLDFALNILGKKKLYKYLTAEILGRSYFCPKCKKIIDSEYSSLESKWAYLKPNKAESTNIHCISCDVEFNVTRKNCIKEKCKGNVIYDYYEGEICLTCFKYQENE